MKVLNTVLILTAFVVGIVVLISQNNVNLGNVDWLGGIQLGLMMVGLFCALFWVSGVIAALFESGKSDIHIVVFGFFIATALCFGGAALIEYGIPISISVNGG